jgi:hypothetical protein
MDQNKNAQGQQNQGQQKQGQQNPNQGQGSKDRNWNDTPSQPKSNREPAEGGRNQSAGNRGNMGGQERGTGSQGERNSSGISNRGMNRSEEQEDLPSRGSRDQDSSDQSER